MSKIKVKFTRDYKVKDDEGNKFKEGKEYELTESSAAHFIVRGAAVRVGSAGAKKNKAAKE